MGAAPRRTVVVSAVNIRKAGTLKILRQTLSYLSGRTEELRVVALVHSRALCDFPGIEYIEMPWCVKGWLRRLWAEYVSMHRISRDLEREDGRPVWTWLSLHDTTPRVRAEHREVYCHNAFPFMRLKASDFIMDPKIGLLVLFTRWLYRINVHKNDSLIVQQEWFADAMSEMLGVPRERFRVIPPERDAAEFRIVPQQRKPGEPFRFLYVSTPDCHKNFEALLRASEQLERELGPGRFQVTITLKGDENRYARWLYKHWGTLKSVDFHGLVAREELGSLYGEADCFVFPSRIESWGLPISEFASVRPGAPMLLSDLPYAHATAAEAENVRWFEPEDWKSLCGLMKNFLN